MLGGAAMLLVLRRWRSSALIGLALTAFLIGLGLQYARVYYELPNGFLQHFNQNDYTARNFLFMGFPFMAIGFLCARHRLAERLSRRGVCCWLVLGLGLILAEAALNFALRADVEQNFDFLASLLVIAPALFLLPQVYFRASHSNFAAKLSSAVYYVHPWFIFGALSLGMAYGNGMAGLVLLLAFGVAPLLSWPVAGSVSFSEGAWSTAFSLGPRIGTCSFLVAQSCPLNANCSAPLDATCANWPRPS